MRERTLDDLRVLGGVYVRLHSLLERPLVTSVNGSGRAPHDAPGEPIQVEILDLIDRIERNTRALIQEARALGAGIARDERIPELITLHQAARIIDVSAQGALQMVRQGRLETIRVGGGVMTTNTAAYAARDERRDTSRRGASCS